MRRLFVLFVLLIAIGLGCDPHDPDPPVSPMDNLRAFTRLYGYVKYFHPSDEAAAVDWNKLAVYGVNHVLPARTGSDQARRLGEIFVPIAPTIQIAHGELPADPHPDLFPASTNGLVPVVWQHYGAGIDEDPENSLYQSARTNRSCSPLAVHFGCPWDFPRPDPGETAELDLGDGVLARVPLAVWSDAEHTLPQGDDDALLAALERVESDDWEARGVGLAAVVVSWNLFQYFYPYFDVVESDWPGELDQALERGLAAESLDTWRDTLRFLVAALHDGHGRVYHDDHPRTGALPIHLAWAEGSLVVIESVDPAVDVGDVITHIDRHPIEAWREFHLARLSGSPQVKEFGLLATLIFDPPDSQVTLTLSHADGSAEDVTLSRISPDPLTRLHSGPVIEQLEDGVYYVDLTRATWVEIEAQLENLAVAPGIVFDLRGYPSDNIVPLLEYMLDMPDETNWMFIPQITVPDRQEVTWEASTWGLVPAEPRLEGAIAFLTDASAISFSESLMGYVHGHRMGDIVGSETAGANGNAHWPELPGGFRMMWTGMKVLRQDGEQLHTLGFPPTLRVEPTVEGIRAGRDEVLEAGLARVRERVEQLDATERRESSRP